MGVGGVFSAAKGLLRSVHLRVRGWKSGGRASGHAVWPWTGAVAEKLGGCCEPVAEAEAGGE